MIHYRQVKKLLWDAQVLKQGTETGFKFICVQRRPFQSLALLLQPVLVNVKYTKSAYSVKECTICTFCTIPFPPRNFLQNPEQSKKEPANDAKCILNHNFDKNPGGILNLADNLSIFQAALENKAVTTSNIFYLKCYSSVVIMINLFFHMPCHILTAETRNNTEKGVVTFNHHEIKFIMIIFSYCLSMWLLLQTSFLSKSPY